MKFAVNFNKLHCEVHPRKRAQLLKLKFYFDFHCSAESQQGRSQDFIMGGGLNGSLGGASLKNFKILNIKLRNFYAMFK